MLARKIIESLNVSPIYFIVAFNLSQNLSLIAGICIYDCKPIHIVIERAFVVDAIQYIELNKYTDEFLSRDLKDRWNLETIKSYI
jgi:hypothetical protein